VCANGTSPNGTVGQIDGQRSPRYAGLATFARLPQRHEVEHYDIAVAGVPFDAGVTYRPGARFGPAAIREASRMLRPYNPALEVSPFKHAQVVDAGDIVGTPFDIERAVDSIEAGVTDLIADGQAVVLMGGDHTIALPALRALAKTHGPVALVHFDAHLDTWGRYFETDLTHGTPFRLASEEGLIVKGASTHVGIRGSLYGESDLLDDERLGFTIIESRDVDRIGTEGIIAAIRSAVGDRPVYVSIDIDVLDPAFAPGTGTPEAGGMTSREVITIVRGMTGLRLVGADVVEVSPAYDHAEVTAVAASNLIYELISIMALQRAVEGTNNT
jgi:agmatinase